MKNIPDIVKIAAQKEGFNSISYAGTLDGAEVFSVGVVDKNGTPVPMGMPNFILLKGNDTSLVCGQEGFDLMFRL